MARQVNGRILVSGQLVTSGPLHVGTGTPSSETDLPLARNGAGAFYIPGTSLAGALREWCHATLGEQHAKLLDQIWGPYLPGQAAGSQPVAETDQDAPSASGQQQTDQDKEWASHIFVDDAVVEPPRGSDDYEIRDGVGIDREWGVAAPQIKFDRAVLPSGTRIKLDLTLELPRGCEDAAQDLLRLLIKELSPRDGQPCRIHLGACKTRGMGGVRFAEKPQVKFQDLATPAGICAVLRDEGQPFDFDREATSIQPEPLPQLDVTIQWQAVGPVMVKSGSDGLTVDMLPLLGGDNGQLAPLIPGSSLKGILRSHAERIVRTLLDLNAEWEEAGYRRFPAQLDSVPLVREIFGQAARHDRRDDSGEKSAANECTHRRGIGALYVEDCTAEPIVDLASSLDLASAADQTQLRQQLVNIGRKNWTQAHHVAIDRWTGGAAEAFLYSVLEPHGEKWAPFHLTLNLSRLPDDLRKPAVALLLLVFRDLAEGRIPIGFAGNRGLGDVQVENITIRGAHEALGLGGTSWDLPGGKLAQLESDVRSQLNDAWRHWLDTQPQGSSHD